jgi:hypothetical protein
MHVSAIDDQFAVKRKSSAKLCELNELQGQIKCKKSGRERQLVLDSPQTEASTDGS